MSLSLRMLLGYFAIVAVGVYFTLKHLKEELKPGVRQAVEETLVDTSNLLAVLLKDDFQTGRLQKGGFAETFSDYQQRVFGAKIYGVQKDKPDVHIYVTDAKGLVLFDSRGLDQGKDYSHWNDVKKTLQGEYGARTTRQNPDVDASAVMYVAAPIRDGEKLLGVVSVGKPSQSLQPYLQLSQLRTTRLGFLLLGLALLIGLGFTYWLSHSMNTLSRYATKVAAGERVAIPEMGTGELRQLAHAMEVMRQKLDGKAYVEQYVQLLTHEMKSPLAAIRGAGELLHETLPEADRFRFSDNVTHEAKRLQQIVENLLELARLEQRVGLKDITDIPLVPLLDEVISSRQLALSERQVSVSNSCSGSAIVRGEKFLIRQALANLVDNAIDFCQTGSSVLIEAKRTQSSWTVHIENPGPVIPDYALSRLGERFYSLVRPHSGKKGTGLGLALVRQVAALHGGHFRIANRADQTGVVAELTLPSAE